MSKQLKTGIVAVIIIALFIWGYSFLKGHNYLIQRLAISM